VLTRIIALARTINDEMPYHLAEMTGQALAEHGAELDGAKIAVLGVAYLEDSDDTRNTPAIPVIEALQKQGATVVAHDPYVRVLDGYEITRDLNMAVAASNAVVIVTRHRPYYDLDLSWLKGVMQTPVLVDGRNVFDAERAQAAGFTYRAIGKGR
jgi:UDP-N-acetyl-D-mannosaminuronic acid dehydrogenase